MINTLVLNSFHKKPRYCAVKSVEVGGRFRGSYCLHNQGIRPDDGGSIHLWNIGQLLQDYMAQ
jgi:hypothetical protein